MFASSHGLHSTARRRGIVLVLVLGMLGLMALIGVTFAAFAGQSLKSGRAYAQGLQRPQAEALMDFALAQLINDTNNPLSAIRGHSLLRDMYGKDSLFRGSSPTTNRVADTNGLMDRVSTGSGISTLHFTGKGSRLAQSTSSGVVTPFYNQLQYQTNIPINGPYQGYDFTRWIVRFTSENQSVQTSSVPQTFEILEDDYSGQYGDQFHHFTLGPALGNTTVDPWFSDLPSTSSDTTAFVYGNPNAGLTSGATPAKPFTALNREHAGGYGSSSGSSSNAFVLDGRFMRAFNGPGLTRPVDAFSYTNPVSGTTSIVNYPFNQAAYGNMRVAGYDPDTLGMDEDYDACDLENWFLAIQSADGQVMIPSFHRPGILTADDWSATAHQTQRAKILRPRQADHSPLFPTDPSVVDTDPSSPQFGKLTYDIDNDGDGVTDSVWLDLGYPATRDPNGKLYKPLFAFMVLGLNGRLPLNTVGNLQARAVGDKTNNGGDTVTYPNSSGQVPYPGLYTPLGNNHSPMYSSQVFFDTPLYDHASHLGYSVNEINPKFALQNAPSNLYPSSAQSPYGVFTDYTAPVPYTQYDDAGVSVALTQMRNILAGTISTDAPTPYPFTSLPVNNNPPALKNFDTNIVFVGGEAHVLPNGIADNNDVATGGQVYRLAPTVAGRWGEPEGIPKTLSSASTTDFDPTYPILHYSNPVRAGRSYFSATGGTNDAMDDDFDGFDPYLADPTIVYSLVQDDSGTLVPTTIPLNSAAGGFTPSTFNRYYPEDVDAFDLAGQRAVASERNRTFVTPQDPAGVGRQMDFMTRPTSDHDFGKGSDTRGRVGFFRYFRPAGLLQEIRYPYASAGGYAYATGSGQGQRYLMPVLLPAGRSADNGVVTSIDDRWTNSLHGYQSMATPETQGTSADKIAVMGARPYDWDPALGQYPAGYVTPPVLYTPTILPNTFTPTTVVSVNSAISSTTGPDVGKVLGDPTGTYPIPYVPGNPPPNGYDATTNAPLAPMVVNGYLGGSLNKDEADEMNLYTINDHDMPYSLSDLEWLYRKQDVDGATLDSRLAQLAPISFLNPADGLTRRRLFSTDAWDLINFSYANDNPIPYAGVLGFTSTFANINTSDHNFNYNSRFMPDASPSLEIMNQIPSIDPTSNTFAAFANPIATEFLYNPTLPMHTGNGDSFTEYVQNSGTIGASVALPLAINPNSPNSSNTPYNVTSSYSTFGSAFPNALAYNYSQIIQPFGPSSAAQVQTPSVAHRDRKINLNFPLPISNDPAEPIRQKWCRETYQLLKAILPPAAVDTPEELAALSQYVVNIIDFRDTDCTTTRFVNTDLVVTDSLTKHSKPWLVAGTTPPTTFDPVANVSPMGVRFATSSDSIGSHFPFDPSLYSPDATAIPNPFLVQHGMEYSPIAINETFAVQYMYGNGGAGPGSVSRGLFVELVNTLTEAEGNNQSRNNASSIDLTGWDMIMTPDEFGWGRPDPISGDVPVVAWPPLTGGAGATFVPDNVNKGQPSGNTTLPATGQVQQYRFTSVTQPRNKVLAVNNNTEKYFVVGGYADGTLTDSAAFNAPGADATIDPSTMPVPTNGVESTYVAYGLTTYDGTGKVKTYTPGAGAPDNPPTFDVVVPRLFIPYNSTVTSGSSQGAYYWVYLRRPANPFDTDDLTDSRPNREMVVVDAMRFPYMDAGRPMNLTTTPTVTVGVNTTTQSTPFSAQRLQPYRGGHLTPVASATTSSIFKFIDPVTGIETTSSPVTTIAPPTPAYAYGYSEQTSPPTGGSGHGQYITTAGATNPTTRGFRATIGKNSGTNRDSNWAHVPFHDRDFANVAELLLVPGCPPGLFTKQFVEEPYPGHAAGATPATGWDAAKLNSNSPPIPPTGVEIGQKDFGYGPPLSALPAVPTFPYLTDNFYYTAASVAPPTGTAALDPGYTHLTTEIGGWTGAGWHKMLEFFEVPSSANGAIGTADLGDNYDWYRADVKPGQLNINLIIDEEVFAGLIDDPRLNEILASTSATTQIPFIVSQIDVNGYPASDTSGNVIGRYPISPSVSTNVIGGTPITYINGRGYSYRDPNAANYISPTTPQLLHGMKAAFSDFLKLRHGGSGYLFAHGGGDVSMGDFTLTVNTSLPTQPVAADRPYRSLSYPDINYTIMRPASLPPSPTDLTNPTPQYLGTAPPLSPVLANLFTYAAQTGVAPYVTHNPAIAPLNGAPASSYLQDPGIKNPFLDIQFHNTTSESDIPPGTRRLAPPYDVQPAATPQPIPAPFPPTIPPTPARRLLQVPDLALTGAAATPSSNASLKTQENTTTTVTPPYTSYVVNQPVVTPQLWSGSLTYPPTLFTPNRAAFAADNLTPQADTTLNNDLGAGSIGAVTDDLRMHPVYRTEMIQKISNLTTVRTQQFATWITVGFFEVVATGTPELSVPDTLGAEIGAGAGDRVRYRAFFVIDRTKATGFNPYYPGNFRDCVTYRRRIE